MVLPDSPRSVVTFSFLHVNNLIQRVMTAYSVLLPGFSSPKLKFLVKIKFAGCRTRGAYTVTWIELDEVRPSPIETSGRVTLLALALKISPKRK